MEYCSVISWFKHAIVILDDSFDEVVIFLCFDENILNVRSLFDITK